MQADFLGDVLTGLSAREKYLPCKYFYDANGSVLFERITELDAYYPTRTELAILAEFGEDIGEEIGPGALIVEPGSGAGLKTRRLLTLLQEPAAYVPVDIDPHVLERTREILVEEFPGLPVLPVAADYTRELRLPALPPDVHARSAVIFYPGSTIGNFDPAAAAAFLEKLGGHLPRPLSLLIGVDLDKDPAILEAAYNDHEGVTAAFNKNILRHINRALDADFDPESFTHVAFYDSAAMRIEMHLQSKKAQRVHIAGETIEFQPGERIHTESSYKYSPEGFQSLAQRAGFHHRRTFIDDDALFSVQLFDAC